MAKSDKKSFETLVREYSGYALEQFVTEGGKGLRSAIWAAMASAIQWDRENRESEKDKPK